MSFSKVMTALVNKCRHSIREERHGNSLGMHLFQINNNNNKKLKEADNVYFSFVDINPTFFTQTTILFFLLPRLGNIVNSAVSTRLSYCFF